MATAGSIVIDLLMRTGAFETDVGRAEKRLQQMQKRAAEAGKAIGTAIAGGAVVAGTALAALAKNGIDAADRLDELSQRLGVSAEKLSALGYAATLTGGNIDTVAGALPRLSKQIAAAGDASSSSAELFRALGIDVRDAAGNMRDVEDVLPEVADRFKELKDDTLEQALAMELFGKSGAEMLEFLNLGSEGLRAMEERAASLGLIVSGETAAAAAEFNDRLGDLKLASEAFALQVAADLLPAISDLVAQVNQFAADGDNARETADALTATLGFLADAGTIAADIFRTIGTAIGGAIAQMDGLRVAAAGVLSLDWSKIREGLTLNVEGRQAAINAAVFGRDNAGQSLVRFGQQRTPAAAAPGMEIDFTRPAPADPVEPAGLSSNLVRFFSGKDKKAGAAKPGKSDAEKEAEALARSFEQLIARQKERNALLQEELRTGEEVTELFRVSYELQNSELSKLSESQKEQVRANAALTDELEKQAKLREEERKATEQFDEVIESIREEIDALTMSNEQWDLRNRLQAAGVTLDSERGQQIKAMTEELHAQARAVADQVEIMDQFRQGASNALSDFVSGTKSAKDALKDFFDDLHMRIIQMISERWMEQLFGAMGTTGGETSGGGLLGSLFGGLFGGGGGGKTKSGGNTKGGGGFDFFGMLGSFFGGGFAQGGQILPDRAYLVGEQGPEMFVPRTAGTVIPNPETSARRFGDASRTISNINHFNFAAPTDPRTQKQVAARVAFETERQVRRSR